MPSAAASARSTSSPGAGAAKRSSTLAAFTLTRLPLPVSTWSEVVLSASTVPALKAPSSSNRTFIGDCGKQGGMERNYTRRATAIRTSLCAT